MKTIKIVSSFAHIDPYIDKGYELIPDKYEHLKDGEYLFRTDNKGERIHLVIHRPYCMEWTDERDTVIEMAEFNLHKHLPHKEYLKLRSMYKYLSRYWKNQCDAYFVAMKWRDIRRTCEKTLLEIDKKLKK